MMKLLVVAYPELATEDYEWILSARGRHEELAHSLLSPHFTFVFPLSGMDQERMAQHIEDHVAGVRSLQFALRSAILLVDDTSDVSYVVLAPDEGFSGIVKLHDRLYTGILEPYLRLDIPFIPHITIGYSRNARACKRICDSLNNEQFEIIGSISTLDLVVKEDNQAWTVGQFKLAR